MLGKLTLKAGIDRQVDTAAIAISSDDFRNPVETALDTCGHNRLAAHGFSFGKYLVSLELLARDLPTAEGQGGGNHHRG